ncbi:MAG: hypothetical protein IPH45_08945 [Bacteroidales bacterium]|nr:hypothetical protein [Bacteroidales bacterium]
MKGKQLFIDKDPLVRDLLINGNEFEHGHRKCLIVKAQKAWETYQEFILIYAVEVLIEYLEYHPDMNFEVFTTLLQKTAKRTIYKCGWTIDFNFRT